MTVLRRLDAVLEDTKPAVLEIKAALDRAGVIEIPALGKETEGLLDKIMGVDSK